MPLPPLAHQRGHALDEAGEGDAAGLEVLGQRTLRTPRPRGRRAARPRRARRRTSPARRPRPRRSPPPRRRCAGRAGRRRRARPRARSRQRAPRTGAGRPDPDRPSPAAAARCPSAVRASGPQWSKVCVDARDAGVGHERVRRLEPDDAAPRGGRADRAALVAADGEVDAVVPEGGRRAARRAARGALGVERVARSARTSSTRRRPRTRGRPCS